MTRGITGRVVVHFPRPRVLELKTGEQCLDEVLVEMAEAIADNILGNRCTGCYVATREDGMDVVWEWRDR